MLRRRETGDTSLREADAVFSRVFTFNPAVSGGNSAKRIDGEQAASKAGAANTINNPAGVQDPSVVNA